jgi:hypothetical protein
MCTAHPGYRTQLPVTVVHTKQFGHEVTDVGTVGLAKALLDERLEPGALIVARQSARQTHLWSFGLAEVQG